MENERNERPEVLRKKSVETGEAPVELQYGSSLVPTLWMLVPTLLLIAYAVLSR